MITHLPNWISLFFISTTLVTIWMFYLSNNKPKLLTALVILWSLAQSILAYTGFYQNTQTFPPRVALVIIPPMLLIIFSLLPKQRDWIYEKRNTIISTFLHTVRLPVEIVLLQLFIHHMVPELMTFEGRNFDIIVGISAPFVGYLYLKNKISTTTLLIWNVIGLCFVLFILTNGILSVESPFQQFGFDQPNRGITYFPFVLLPATIVPIVIWTHLTDIMKLLKESKKDTTMTRQS